MRTLQNGRVLPGFVETLILGACMGGASRAGKEIVNDYKGYFLGFVPVGGKFCCGQAPAEKMAGQDGP
jgi:hypothetical protein